jgi:hypothetical protein
VGGVDRVVGDHHDRLTEEAGGVAQKGQQRRVGTGAEGAGRLVGEDQLGAGDQHPPDRDPLLLPAGLLRRAAEAVDGVGQPPDLAVLLGHLTGQRGHHRVALGEQAADLAQLPLDGD